MSQHLVSLYVSQRLQRAYKRMQRPVKRLNCPKFVPSLSHIRISDIGNKNYKSKRDYGWMFISQTSNP